MSVNQRGKYWRSDPTREAKAEAKRNYRRHRNMRNAVRQGTHKRVATSGTPENPGTVWLVPVV